MNKLTTKFDENLKNDIENYQAERRIEFFQSGDRDNRIPKNYKEGIKNEAAVKKADQVINELSSGGEVGLHHLGAISNVINRPIKVLDSKGRVMKVIGGDLNSENAVEVQYHKDVQNDKQGHYTLPGNVQPSSINTGRNNNLFDVISEQTKMEPNEMRAKTVDYMRENKHVIANQSNDIIRLEKMKKSALILGGDDCLADYSLTQPIQIINPPSILLPENSSPNIVINNQDTPMIPQIETPEKTEDIISVDWDTLNYLSGRNSQSSDNSEKIKVDWDTIEYLAKPQPEQKWDSGILSESKSESLSRSRNNDPKNDTRSLCCYLFDCCAYDVIQREQSSEIVI